MLAVLLLGGIASYFIFRGSSVTTTTYVSWTVPINTVSTPTHLTYTTTSYVPTSSPNYIYTPNISSNGGATYHTPNASYTSNTGIGMNATSPTYNNGTK